jgi:uncharacterized DUF497 family protein
MKITWDENKSRSNQQKHRVSFETAQQVFDDPFHLSRQDRIEGGEQRWQSLGLVQGGVVLLVAHTYTTTEREETVRIISARKADRSERRIYEQQGH